MKQLKKYSSEIESIEKGFIISLENTTLKTPSIWQTKKEQNIYRAKMSRAAGAYIIDLKGAADILKDLENNKCARIIDWWHNDMIDRKIIKYYWAYPSIVEQGSHNGLMSSTISTKSSSTKRKISWFFQKAYKTYFRRFFNEKNIY